MPPLHSRKIQRKKKSNGASLFVLGAWWRCQASPEVEIMHELVHGICRIVRLLAREQIRPKRRTYFPLFIRWSVAKAGQNNHLARQTPLAVAVSRGCLTSPNRPTGPGPDKFTVDLATSRVIMMETCTTCQNGSLSQPVVAGRAAFVDASSFSERPCAIRPCADSSWHALCVIIARWQWGFTDLSA